MRKVILIALVVLLVLTGCTSVTQDPNKVLENKILKAITKEHGDIVDNLFVKDYKGEKYIMIKLVEDIDYDNLGTYFTSIVGTCTTYSLEFSEITVSTYQDGKLALSYETTYGEYDYLMDSRGEEPERYAVKSPDELEELLQTIK